MSNNISAPDPQPLQDLQPHLGPLAATETALAEHAKEIRDLAKRGVGDIIEIGRRLTEAKRLVGHGNWLSWLDREFGWSDDTALNFMRIYEMSKSRNFRNLNLPISALFLVARPSTLAKACNEILRRAEHGERFTYDQIKKIISGHKAPVDKASSPTAKRPKNKSKPDDALAELIRCFDNAPEEAQTTFLTRLGGERILKVQSLRSWFQERLDRQRARVTNDAGQANMEPAPETKITKAFKAALSLVEAGDKHSAEAISKLHAINRILAGAGYDLHAIGITVTAPKVMQRVA